MPALPRPPLFFSREQEPGAAVVSSKQVPRRRGEIGGDDGESAVEAALELAAVEKSLAVATIRRSRRRIND